MSDSLKHDLNALKSLFLLYRERSVTKAAVIAGVTQPSMSRTLNKLREVYNDRLFVRQKDELIATPKAELLMTRLSPLFEQISVVIDAAEPLEPDTATGKFHFCAPEFISKYAMANVPSGILDATPNIEFYYSYWDQDVTEDLKSGDIDLAFGYLPECPNHVKKITLATDQLVMLSRPGHPLFATDKSSELANLLSYPHIALKHSGVEDDAVDRSLAAKGMGRHCIVHTPDLVAAFSLLVSSDYLMLAPKKLANHLCSDAHHSPWPLEPIEIEYSLYWGAIKDQDNLHKFIRNHIGKTFEAQLKHLLG